MGFADLSPAAQSGLQYRANTIKGMDGQPRFANARDYGDFLMETAGLEALQEQNLLKRIARQRKIEANADLAVLIDAMPEPA